MSDIFWQKKKNSEISRSGQTLPSVKDLFVRAGGFPKPVSRLIIGLVLFSAFDDLRSIGANQGGGGTYLVEIFLVVGYVVVTLLALIKKPKIPFLAHSFYLFFLYLSGYGQPGQNSLALIYVLLGILVFSLPIPYAFFSFILSTIWCFEWSRNQTSGDVSQPVFLISLVYIAMTIGIALVLRYIAAYVAYDHSRISAAEEASRLEALASFEREHELRQHTISMQEELARELHDVIGHQVTSIAMRANLALLDDTDDENQRREALENIASTARQALADMRMLVSMMKEPDSLGEGVGSIDLRSFYERIVTYLRNLHFVVETKFSGDSYLPLPLSIENSATAILREGATNIVKHAPPDSKCFILVEISDKILRIQMRNELGEGAVDFPISGFGLNGLRQRIEATKGRFFVGPAGGWWVLDVEIKR